MIIIMITIIERKKIILSIKIIFFKDAYLKVHARGLLQSCMVSKRKVSFIIQTDTLKFTQLYISLSIQTPWFVVWFKRFITHPHTCELTLSLLFLGLSV